MSNSHEVNERAHDDCVTIDEARAIAMDAADVGSTRALQRFCAVLGVDLDDFESVQEFRGDLQWVKSGRRISRNITGKSISSIVGVVSIGVIIGLYDWVRSVLVHLVSK